MRSRELFLSFVIVHIMSDMGFAQRKCVDEDAIDLSVCNDIVFDSIASYEDCAERIYDQRIEAFKQVGPCVLGEARESIEKILLEAEALAYVDLRASKNEALALSEQCLKVCNENLAPIYDALQPKILAERNSSNLDEHRRTSYQYDHLVYFTKAILHTQQLYSSCTPCLLELRSTLAEFDRIDTTPPDFCAHLEPNFHLKDVLNLKPLPPERFDPEIDLGWHYAFRAEATNDCGPGQPCFYATAEGGQVLEEVDNILVNHKKAVGTLGGAIAAYFAPEILSAIGFEAAAAAAAEGGATGSAVSGGVGAVVAIVVVAILVTVEYFIAKGRLDDFRDYVRDRDREVASYIEDVFPTEQEIEELKARKCSEFSTEVVKQVDDLVSAVDSPGAIQEIDRFFSDINALQTWYNDLFLWATDKGASGPFIDELAKQELVNLKRELCSDIYAGRAEQTVGEKLTRLAGLQVRVSQMECRSNKHRTLRRMRSAIRSFNGACNASMRALGSATVPLVHQSGLRGSVRCRYDGFVDGVDRIEIRQGEGLRATAKIFQGDRELAEIADFSSATVWSTRTELPGFSCFGSRNEVYGTSADNRLRPGTYALSPQIAFADDAIMEAKDYIRTLDRIIRRNAVVCMRKLGDAEFGFDDLARSSDACGINTQPLR